MRIGLRRLFGYLLLLLVPLAVRPAATSAQTKGVVRPARENFRKNPNGNPLATLFRGAELPVLAQRGGWAQVELQGWIWAPSVTADSRNGFDLRVSAPGGENLRARAQGPILARLLEGCLLERLAADGNWVRVRRRGWVWRESLELSGTPVAATEAAGAESGRAESREASGPAVLTAPAPLAIYATPDGDTVALFQPGAQGQILGRTGDWVRVRVDGWVYGPAALDSAVDVADTGGLTPAQLRADPGRYKGALVRWRVQVVSLRRAERARVDFEEGEPFLLARGPAGDPGFVYLAVPPSLLEVAQRLEPLDYVTVVGRVRTGRSSQVGSPVIDLTDIEVDRPGG